MTEQEYRDYYADLLILQYKTQPKARDTIGALVSNGPSVVSASDTLLKYIVVGTPAITDGVVSNITANNYILLDPTFDNSTLNSLEVQVKFTTGNRFSHPAESVIGTVNGTFSFYLTDDRVLHGVYIDDVGTHDNVIAEGIQVNTTYYAKMQITYENGAATAILSISIDGINWTENEYSADDQETISGTYYYFGAYPFSGKLYLYDTYFELNGTRYFGLSTIEKNLPQAIINGFDINTASGVQLDILGKYIGLSRKTKALIGALQTNILSDEQYRVLLKLKLIKNCRFSSTSQIKSALYAEFPNSIRVFDNRDMTYDYELSDFWQDLLGVITSEDLLPTPMGVGYTAVIVPDLLELYGYSDYSGLNDNPNGYSSYTDGFRGRYLSYGDKFAGEE